MILATWPVWPVVSRSSAAADTANAPSLVISQLKITSSNGQFVTLYNATNNTLDMSRYQLEYFNNYDLAKATSSRLIALSGTVPPHGYFMVNDSTLLLCYQLSINSVSLGFSSTAGMVELLAMSQGAAGGSVTPALQDYAAWSKTPASGAQTLPANTNASLLRQPVDAQYNPLITSAGSGSWLGVQPDAASLCSLVSATNSSTPVLSGLNQLLPSSEPPAAIITENAVAGDTSAPASGLPPADIGLMAPQVTELLPNPSGTGNDDTEEFIELYNANDTSFDLSGFSLQAGTTTTHKYAFPAGTQLPANSFKAYYSSQTGLAMSNTGGQAKLLDPLGNSVSASGNYGTAKDGQAWALAQSKWYWTTAPTPNAANVIQQPAAGTKSSKQKATAKKAAQTKAAKLKTKKTKKLKASTTPAAVHQEAVTTSPIHPKVLAVIGGLGLLYLAYEYRADITNRIYQCRQYLEARRQNRLKVEGRRSN
jgi:hypothetical protein